jgi:site-specific DNA-cytosine methylase
LRHLDLFSGIGGFALAASWVWGDELEIVGFCEIDEQCQKLLRHHFPGIIIKADIRKMVEENVDSIDIMAGGDPCPVRSKARKIQGKIINPDLSGYFLALVGRFRPRWMVRENVPASDDVHFTTALEMLGYRTLILRTNAASFTGQQRIRDFIVASNIATSWESQFFSVFKQNGNSRYHSPRIKEKPLFACLTTHRTRWDARDNFIYDGRLRILDGDERRLLSGYPKGWFNGFSETTIAKMTGNCVVPQVAALIMQEIKLADEYA